MKDYLNPMSLGYVALMRSPFTGSALSPAADVLEMTGKSPVPSIRTTTNRYRREKNTDEVLGQYITQLPAVKEGLSVPRALLMGAQKAAGEDMTQRDLKQLLQLVPFQTFVPLNVYIQSLVNSSGLPEKRSK